MYERFRKITQTPIKQASVLIIGEAPGSSEIARDEPFVGLSGQFLREALSVSRLPNAEECYITNALLCRPPKEAIRREAIEQCRKRVQREIELVGPRLILALGNIAVYSLTGEYSTRITTLHGSPFKYWTKAKATGESVGDLPIPTSIVMPCLHPAKILRTPGDCASFMLALDYAAELLNGGNIRDPGVSAFEIVADNEKEVNGAVATLLEREGLVGTDIETGYSSDPSRGSILVFGVCYEKNKTLIFPSYVFKYPAIQTLFESTKLEFGWQGGKYDTPWLRYKGLPARIDQDSMLLHYCLNENEGGHDLETLAIRYLGAKPYKHVVKAYTKPGDAGYENVPVEVLYPYLAKDCDYAYQLIGKFRPVVESDPLLNYLYYTMLLPGSRFLRRVQRAGFFVNVAHAEQLRVKLEKQIDGIIDKILDIIQPLWDPDQYRADTGHKTAPEIFNPGSPEQLKWMLFTRLKLPPKRGKKFSTDRDVLESLQYKHLCIEPLLELRSVQKVKSTYVDGVLKRLNPEDLRVRGTFNLHRTVTGRLSSTDPNLQNIKDVPEVKTMFGAPRGRTLIVADYKGAELRVLAHLSKDKALREVFLAGRDLHEEVRKLLGTTRIKAKTVNFGIAYGRTAYSIAEEFKMSEQEAQWLIDEWFRRFPEAKAYMDQCDRDVEAHKVFTTPFGRKRRFGVLTFANIGHVKNEARNFRVQSIASDLTFMSGMALEWDLRKMSSEIVNLVHDNLIAEALGDPDSSSVKASVDLIRKVMEDVPKRPPINTNIPFAVDIKVGQDWGNMTPVEREVDTY